MLFQRQPYSNSNNNLILFITRHGFGWREYHTFMMNNTQLYRILILNYWDRYNLCCWQYIYMITLKIFEYLISSLILTFPECNSPSIHDMIYFLCTYSLSFNSYVLMKTITTQNTAMGKYRIQTWGWKNIKQTRRRIFKVRPVKQSVLRVSFPNFTS